jgi:CheY-like chemotaxis protein
LALWRTSPTPADLYVLDLMMPAGDALDLETAGFGLTSGIEIFRRLRSKFPTVPVIILTSVSNPAILDALPLDENTIKEAKIDVLPSELVGRVNSLLYGKN